MTGMPLLKMLFIRRPLALAEPVPLTVAILMTKSLMREAWECGIEKVNSGDLGLFGLQSARLVRGMRPVHLGLLHIPCGRRTTLGTQATMHAEVLVLHHHAPGLRERRGYEQRLRQISGGCLEARAQVRLLPVRGDGQT